MSEHVGRYNFITGYCDRADECMICQRRKARYDLSPDEQMEKYREGLKRREEDWKDLRFLSSGK